MLMVSTNTILSTNILLDCGTTLDIFISKEYFITYIESSNKFVTVGGYNKVSVTSWGLVLFSAKLSSSQLSITLCNILYIFYLDANLVSLGALHCQGVSVQSFNEGLALFKNSKKLFRASLTCSTRILYYIQCTSPVTGATYLAGSLFSMCLWHQHMGHLSPQAIDFMQHQNLVKGLEINIPCEFDHICSSCTNRK